MTDHRQQLIDEAIRIEQVLKKHGFEEKLLVQESSFDRIIDALQASEDAGHDVQRLLDAEREKTKALQAENRRLEKQVAAGTVPPQARKWDPWILGFLSERARRETPTATRKEIATACGCSSSVVDGVLHRLIAEGLIRRVHAGTYQAVKAAP